MESMSLVCTILRTVQKRHSSFRIIFWLEHFIEGLSIDEETNHQDQSLREMHFPSADLKYRSCQKKRSHGVVHARQNECDLWGCVPFHLVWGD
mmetsp:Transcript_18948/g.32609  ORF Transcript_18948/g.32609 Transcript_18948/m.32609 type:complete len:93 (-) Transcript_18948:666-944(-)